MRQLGGPPGLDLLRTPRRLCHGRLGRRDRFGRLLLCIFRFRECCQPQLIRAPMRLVGLARRRPQLTHLLPEALSGRLVCARLVLCVRRGRSRRLERRLQRRSVLACLLRLRVRRVERAGKPLLLSGGLVLRGRRRSLQLARDHKETCLMPFQPSKLNSQRLPFDTRLAPLRRELSRRRHAALVRAAQPPSPHGAAQHARAEGEQQ